MALIFVIKLEFSKNKKYLRLKYRNFNRFSKMERCIPILQYPYFLLNLELPDHKQQNLKGSCEENRLLS